MLQQLTNLSDKELISRARKLKDQEAEGVLLERYSHLMVAVCLPYLSTVPGTAADDVFPALLQRLSNTLKTQTIHKVNEWIHYNVKSIRDKSDRNLPFFTSTESREIQQVEGRIEKAAMNNMEQQQLVAQMNIVINQLPAEEKYFLQKFYLEQQTLAQLADGKKYSIDKTRQILKNAKRHMASILMKQSHEQ
jgi:DNA-directed RNA polymerase specialized sigma24 family protein